MEKFVPANWEEEEKQQWHKCQGTAEYLAAH
jgi:hypothetical protein